MVTHVICLGFNDICIELVLFCRVRGKPKVEDDLKTVIAKLADRFEMYRSLVNDVFNQDPKSLCRH